MKDINYIIFLPPSESKLEGGDKKYSSVKSDNSNYHLNKERKYLYDNLISYINNSDISQLKKLFLVNKDDLVIKAKDLLQNHNNENTLRAIDRYKGVMFKYLNYNNLNDISKENAKNSILFIDGLFGLLKINDFIPNYKLSISAKFTISDKIINLQKYWRDILQNDFKNIFKSKIIIDILPKSHREVIDRKIIDSHNNYYEINFYENKNNIIKNSGHNSKELKGEFIRYILNFNKIDLKIIKNFKHSKGYKYSNQLSDKNKIIFLKS